jgi:hypothetical protein
MRRELVSFALVGLWAACQGAGPEDGPTTPEPQTGDTGIVCEAQGLALGTGVLDFVPLQEGQTLDMIHGQQGGYHLPLAARACGVGETGMFHFTGTTSSGETIVNVSLSRLWVPEDSCCSVALDVLGYIFLYDYTVSPPELAGEALQLSLQVDDFQGLVLSDEVQIVMGPPPE